MRPKKNRCVKCSPGVTYFKPRGTPLVKLEEVALTLSGLEALRLADLMGLSHEEAGKSMNVSRATFGRILEKARKNNQNRPGCLEKPLSITTPFRRWLCVLLP